MFNLEWFDLELTEILMFKVGNNWIKKGCSWNIIGNKIGKNMRKI